MARRKFVYLFESSVGVKFDPFVSLRDYFSCSGSFLLGVDLFISRNNFAVSVFLFLFIFFIFVLSFFFKGGF